MKKYMHKGTLLAIVYKDKDWVEGLNFITPDSLLFKLDLGGTKEVKN